MRHDPDSTYGHILKNLTKNETFIDVIVNTYINVASDEDFELCCSATRLLFNMICGLESEDIFQETVSL